MEARRQLYLLVGLAVLFVAVLLGYNLFFVKEVAPTVLVAEEMMVDTQEERSLVHLNTATAQELETLPGIGPVLAERIVTYREEQGEFTSLLQLQEVAGIGEKLYTAIVGQITL